MYMYVRERLERACPDTPHIYDIKLQLPYVEMIKNHKPKNERGASGGGVLWVMWTTWWCLGTRVMPANSQLMR